LQAKYGHSGIVTLLLDQGTAPDDGILGASEHAQETVMFLLLGGDISCYVLVTLLERADYSNNNNNNNTSSEQASTPRKLLCSCC
jgi:hypothetical protein